MTDATWDFISPNWNEPAGPAGSNWNGGSGNAPDGTAFFPDNNFNHYNILFFEDTKVQQIVFGSTKPYTFAISGQTVEITGNGISTGSAAIPTFTITAGALRFENASTAANVTINVTPTLNGELFFDGNSTAFKAQITVGDHGGVVFDNFATAAAATIVANAGGGVAFFNSSNAGVSNISLQGTSNVTGTLLSFLDTSTAAQATIADVGGQIIFEGHSNSGNSTINLQSGSASLFFLENSAFQDANVTNAGVVSFLGLSTGGSGSIDNSGIVTFTGQSPPGAVNTGGNHLFDDFSIGSITGDGLILFGNTGVQLHITGTPPATGSALAGPLHDAGAAVAASFSDTISGVISGSGGITMDAAGTLTLSAANTYTGDTVTTNGTIELAATGSIAGNFDFQNTPLNASQTLTLQLDAPNLIAGTINGYAKGDEIDIAFHNFTQGDQFVWTENPANTGGTLSLENAAGMVITSLSLSGLHTQNEFTVGGDGQGGTMFTDNVAGRATPASVAQEINGLYVTLYGIAATQAGVDFWENVLHTFDPSATPGSAISVNDQTYLGVQMTAGSPVVNGTTYFATLYPASMSDMTFVEALYQNMSNFVGTVAGDNFWFNLLQQAEASDGGDVIGARESIAGQFVHDFMSNDLTVGVTALGVSQSDYSLLVAGQQALLNRAAVSQYYARVQTH